jgi:hypothetical protein
MSGISEERVSGPRVPGFHMRRDEKYSTVAGEQGELLR